MQHDRIEQHHLASATLHMLQIIVRLISAYAILTVGLLIVTILIVVFVRFAGLQLKGRFHRSNFEHFVYGIAETQKIEVDNTLPAEAVLAQYAHQR